MYKKVANPKLDNFAISVWKMNLVKNQEFIGQLDENQPINILLQWFKFFFFYFYLLWENIKKYLYVIKCFMNL